MTNKGTLFQNEQLKVLQKEIEKLKKEKNDMEQHLKHSLILSEASFEGLFIHDRGILIDMNNEFLRIFGYSREELIGKDMLRLLFPEKYNKKLEERISLNYSEPIDVEAKRKDGSLFDVEIEGRDIECNGKSVRATSIRNITKRKKAERAFVKEKLFSDNLINSLPGIFYLYKLIGDSYKLVKWNKNHETVTGYSFSELKNKVTSDFFTEEEYPKIEDAIRRIFYEGSARVEGNLKLKSGKTIPYLFEGYYFEEHNEYYFMGVGVDISHQKELEQKILGSIVETEENERTRFSVELHDGLSPLLSACKIYAEAIDITKSNQRKEQAVKMLSETLDQAISHMHEISNNISPHILRNYGLETAVKSYYSNLGNVTNLKFHFYSSLKNRLKQNIETSLYRIIVELINNSLKYAFAQNIEIKITKGNHKLLFDYKDDGKGFDTTKTIDSTSGMGIHNIANRVKSLKGVFIIDSGKNEGVSVSIEIPLE